MPAERGDDRPGVHDQVEDLEPDRDHRLGPAGAGRVGWVVRPAGCPRRGDGDEPVHHRAGDPDVPVLRRPGHRLRAAQAHPVPQEAPARWLAHLGARPPLPADPGARRRLRPRHQRPVPRHAQLGQGAPRSRHRRVRLRCRPPPPDRRQQGRGQRRRADLQDRLAAVPGVPPAGHRLQAAAPPAGRHPGRRAAALTRRAGGVGEGGRHPGEDRPRLPPRRRAVAQRARPQAAARRPRPADRRAVRRPRLPRRRCARHHRHRRRRRQGGHRLGVQLQRLPLARSSTSGRPARWPTPRPGRSWRPSCP